MWSHDWHPCWVPPTQSAQAQGLRAGSGLPSVLSKMLTFTRWLAGFSTVWLHQTQGQALPQHPPLYFSLKTKKLLDHGETTMVKCHLKNVGDTIESTLWAQHHETVSSARWKDRGKYSREFNPGLFWALRA